MKPPSVFREGTKKTVWANFQEICKLYEHGIEANTHSLLGCLERPSNHVFAWRLPWAWVTTGCTEARIT